MPTPSIKEGSKIKRYLKKIGPGIITAALVFGPGSLTINTKLGASFGYSLLWVLVLTVILMTAFTKMSARIGLDSSVSFIERIKNELGRPLAFLVGIGIFLTTASFQAGNTVGAAVAFSELFSTSLVLWIILFTSAAIFLLFFKSFYKILEKLMIGLVVLMLLSFLLTIIMASPDISEILKGFVPSIPKGSEYLIITLTASSFSIVGAFYQSYLVREKGWKPNEVKDCMNESRNGIIVLGLLSTLVMLCASAVLHQNNIEVRSASDLGMALEPLFGPLTSSVFMIGFFAASFSSMVGNATIGGVILADTFFSESNLSSFRVRSMIILVVLIGAVVAYIFGALPLELIIFAQGITIMIVPLAAVIILIFANSKKMAVELKNTKYSNVMGVVGILVLLLMSAYSIDYLFFK
ncbi:Nramp family divalent metal transporter [uncultured Kriegella sp.]|uniref:Nramp family divalent metal transporter n=1 Tax=uncultured Kriegella sp. TaxID=1798910 RepID=UPI0030DB9FC2|tara:strand:+ start:148330 stop:149556 length:1227 start_codon:yes stop_codon:yes gene_type:complete